MEDMDDIANLPHSILSYLHNQCISPISNINSQNTISNQQLSNKRLINLGYYILRAVGRQVETADPACNNNILFNLFFLFIFFFLCCERHSPCFFFLEPKCIVC